MLINVATFLCLAGPALAALECTDWQGNTFMHGEELYPNKDDPCHKCLCDEGSLTMCRTVSCAPPNCPYLRKIPGQCCEFQCLTDTFENSTAIPPFDRDNTGSPSNATMTDLGLRLVASTVTTFLILALLLFLIHRLRQRRLMLALRRYSRRREPLDDSDDISYSPEFFGIQCPPYEDPPPPYSPPKPPHFRLSEQPPPYEAIDSTVNNQTIGGGGSSGTNVQNINRANAANSSVVGANSGVNSIVREMNCLNNGGSNRDNSVQNGRMVTSGDGRVECIEMTERVTSPERNRNERERSNGNRNRRNESTSETTSENDGASVQNSLNVHFRNSLVGLPSITMGVQNRRFNRNRLSDGNFHAHRNFAVNGNPALNLEIRNTNNNAQRHGSSQNRHSYVHTYQEQSSSTTDIGESTTSAESLQSSPNFSPESPETENENANLPESLGIGEAFPDDADMTVRQFLDRQFGRGSKVRRYPTTMSQSWTSSVLNSSTMPGFRQSVSIGSFQPAHFDQPEQPDASRSSGLISDCHKQLPRSKSEHLKTNGSLRSQPYKGTVRTQPTFLPHTGFAARVSYVEPDDLPVECENRASNDNQNSSLSGPVSSHANSSFFDSNLSECSASLSSSHSHIRIDPGDIIVTRRQDDLRELRLSHLLHNPGKASHNFNMNSNGNGAVPLHRSHSLNSVCSETGEKSLVGVAISNDMPYPTVAIGSKQGSRSSATKSAKKSIKNVVQSDSMDMNGNINNVSTSNSTQETGLKEVHRSPGARQQSSGVRRPEELSISWHGDVVESGDENTVSWAQRTDTLGRNVNSNFTKKTCADKDVSNLCFPLFKPSNFEVCHVTGVPSSDMRACASQLYNLETEEKLSKKDKKKHFLKRHSTSCFPAKRETSVDTSQSPSRLTHKLRSSFSKDRQTSERSGESCSADSHKKSHPKKSSSRDRKSATTERPVVHKPRQYFDDTNGVVTDLTPPCLIHSNLTPCPVSILESKVQHSEGASVDVVSGSRQRGNRSSRRSKSLGRCDNFHSSATDKKSELCPNHRAQGRKKKCHSRQSFPGTHSFHQELEHVLEKQRSAIKTSMHGMSDHSITRV